MDQKQKNLEKQESYQNKKDTSTSRKKRPNIIPNILLTPYNLQKLGKENQLTIKPRAHFQKIGIFYLNSPMKTEVKKKIIIRSKE